MALELVKLAVRPRSHSRVRSGGWEKGKSVGGSMDECQSTALRQPDSWKINLENERLNWWSGSKEGFFFFWCFWYEFHSIRLLQSGTSIYKLERSLPRP